MGKFKSTAEEHEDGTISLDIVCEECGKPIVESNEFGMFCEDRCGYEESKKAGKKIEELIKMFTGIIGVTEDFDLRVPDKRL